MEAQSFATLRSTWPHGDGLLDLCRLSVIVHVLCAKEWFKCSSLFNQRTKVLRKRL
jgi:hypothetical protein